MANVLVEETSLQDIADAIRSKLSVATTYKPSEMADAINSISSGGITPTGTISITTNGTHDVTTYAVADVSVSGGVTPTGTKQISITSNGTTTEDVTNYASAEISVNVSGGSSYTELTTATIPRGTVGGVDYGNNCMVVFELDATATHGEVLLKMLNGSTTHNMWIKSGTQNKWIDNFATNDATRFSNVSHSTVDGYELCTFDIANITLVYFGACWTDTNYSQTNAFKYLKFYDSSNSLVHHFVPILLNGQVLFYDKVKDMYKYRNLYQGFIQGEAK